MQRKRGEALAWAVRVSNRGLSIIILVVAFGCGEVLGSLREVVL